MNVSELQAELSRREFKCQTCDYIWHSRDKRRPKTCPVCGANSILRITGEQLRRDGFIERVEQVFKALTYKEREVLKLRYGIEDGYVYTQAEVGKIFKVSHTCVWKVEVQAIRKLRHPSRIDMLRKLGFLSKYARLTMPGAMAELMRRISNA